MGNEIFEQCLSEIGCGGNEGKGMTQGVEVGDTGYERTT